MLFKHKTTCIKGSSGNAKSIRLLPGEGVALHSDALSAIVLRQTFEIKRLKKILSPSAPVKNQMATVTLVSFLLWNTCMSAGHMAVAGSGGCRSGPRDGEKPESEVGILLRCWKTKSGKEGCERQ